MKKATFIAFLFAVLMVALLVSCNTSPDPLLGETSSEITTAGITTDAVTTEEITTEEATTAEETLDLDPDWVNDTTPAPYRYLEGLPNDKWYFDWTPLTASYAGYGMKDMIFDRECYPYIEDSERYVIQTPRRYETEKDGLLFRFDFFEEKHIYRSFLQIQITVINISKDPVTINDSPLFDTWIMRKNAPPHVADGFEVDTAFDWEEQKLWTATGLESALTPFTLSYGESYQFDRVAVVGATDPSNLQWWTHLRFKLFRVDRTPDDGVSGKTVIVDVPIEFVEYESVSP